MDHVRDGWAVLDRRRAGQDTAPMSEPSRDPGASPAGPLLDYMTSSLLVQAVFVAAELGIADDLADGPADAGTLGARRGFDPSALYRLLRALPGSA